MWGRTCLETRAVAANLRMCRVLVLLLIGLSTSARAGDELMRRVDFHITAQPLPAALIAFSGQAGIQVMTDGKDLAKLSTAGVNGRYSIGKALQFLLNGTGLGFSLVGHSTVAITKSTNTATPSTSRSRGESEGDARTQHRDSSGPNSRKEQALRTPLNEIVVTGSRIPRTAKEGAQEVKIYTSQEIQNSGQTTAAEFLNALPEVSTSAQQSNLGSFAGQETVQLHGLPVGTTLVLINGHRIEDSGVTSGANDVFDLNNIPAAAVDHIEIVPVGSSAIYGSDAIAGVVNIVLKKQLDGFAASGTYGHASDYDESAGSVSWGKTWSKASISLLATYQTNSGLYGYERPITANNDHSEYAAEGGTDARYTYCNPGNVYSANGANLNGLNAPFAGIPSGIQGTPSVGDFGATAGTLNRCSLFSELALVPVAHRYGVVADGTYDLTDSIQLFTELMYSHQQQSQGLFNAIISEEPVPAANPFNPFGENVGVSYQFNNFYSQYGLTIDFIRPLIGARGALFAGWTWELSTWEAQDRDTIQQPNDINYAALGAALASPDPSQSINLFTSGSPASPAVLQSIFQTSTSRYLGQTQAVNGFVRGPVLKLPWSAGGTVQLVLGGEYDRDKLTSTASTTGQLVSTDIGRDVDSFFVESRVPLLTNPDHPESGDTLALSLADRYDDYDDFGSTTNPQYGIEWRPSDTLLVRASYAQSYKAPGLVQLYQASTTYNGGTVTDPENGNLAVPVKVTIGGNTHLLPETGQSRSVGIVWSSTQVKGLVGSLTYWGIDEMNRITTPTAQEVVSNPEYFPDRVVRGSDGTIELVDLNYANFGALTVDGLDLDLTYRFRTSIGEFTPSFSVSDIYKYEAAVAPNTPPVDRLSRATFQDAWAPRYKGTARLAWQLGVFTAAVDTRYVSSYLDYQNGAPNDNEIGNLWIWDANATYQIGEQLGGTNQYVRGLYVGIGVINLFDRQPQYSNYDGGYLGYDPEEFDIRGRLIHANFGVHF